MMRDRPGRQGDEDGGACPASAGFTLIEVVMATLVASTAFLGIWAAVAASFGAVEGIRAEARRMAYAEDLMERLLMLPFGRAGEAALADAAPGEGGDLAELLDEDGDAGGGTLHALAARATDLGGEVARWADPLNGRIWVLIVTPDIDGDGRLGGGATPEDGAHLLRVEILQDEQVVLQTVRTDAP